MKDKKAPRLNVNIEKQIKTRAKIKPNIHN